MIINPFLGGVLTCVASFSLIVNIIFISLVIKGRKR